MGVRDLMRVDYKQCVSLATTARPRERVRVGADTPQGGMNLYSLQREMRAPAQIFIAAKFVIPYRGETQPPQYRID